MLKITIPQTMTKEHETTLILDFYNGLPADSYLKELLAGLPEYCAEQIRNDWTISPLETIRNNAEQLSRQDQQISKFDEVEASYVKTITRKEERIAQLEERRNHDRQVYVDLQDQLEAAKAEAKEQRLRAAGAEMEIQELKAKLYDLLVAGGKINV